MNIEQISKELNLTIVYASETGLNCEVTGGYVADLLSNVMGQAKSGDVWITMQGHQNIIAVAALVGLSAVIISGGTLPEAETIRKAQVQEVCLLSTTLSSFELAGKLYELGIGKV